MSEAQAYEILSNLESIWIILVAILVVNVLGNAR